MVSQPQTPANRPTRPPVGPPPRKPRKRKRRWILCLFWLMLALVIFVGLLPYLASWVPAVRNFLLARAVPDLNGSITAGGASLGWEKPIAFRGISIQSSSKMPVVAIDKLGGNRPLWKILLKPSVLGTYTIEKPRLTVVVYPDGTTNLTEVFTWTDPTAPLRPPRKVPDVSLGVRMVDGSVEVCDHLGQNAWVAEPINFHFRIEPSSRTSDGRTWLNIPAQKVFDHVQATPQICHGMLQYIAPVMAEVTRTEGAFSIELNRWNLPLDAPREGTGKGIFTVHKLAISAGPIIEKTLNTLGISSQLVSIDEAPIRFELADGRVHHEGLQFHVGRIKLTTSGSVGVEDKTLEMTMVVTFPKKVKIHRPIIEALAGQSVSIPIRGTLSRPEVDLRVLTRSVIKAMPKIINRFSQPPKDEEDGTSDGSKKDSGAEPAIDVNEVLDSARELIRRRRERLQKPPLFSPSDTKTEEPKTRNLLPADGKSTLKIPPEIDTGVVRESIKKLLRDREGRLERDPKTTFPFVDPRRDRPLLDRLLTPSERENEETIERQMQ